MKIFSRMNKIVSFVISIFGPYLHFWPLIRLLYIFKKDFLALGKIFDIKGKFFSFLILIKITQTYVVSGGKKISKKRGGGDFSGNQENIPLGPVPLFTVVFLVEDWEAN